MQADNFFYFSKEKIEFEPFGTLNEDIYKLLIEFISELGEKGVTINQIFSKAKKIDN